MRNWWLFICLSVIICSCAPSGNNCPAGYTGENCNVPLNEKYVGTYACEQTGPLSGVVNYTVILNPDTDILSQFRISNLDESGFTEKVTTVIHSDDPNKFSMVKQPLGATGYEVEIFNGVSNNYGNNIIADYSIYNELGLVETRSVVFTK